MHGCVRDTIWSRKLRGCVLGGAVEQSRLVHVNDVSSLPVRHHKSTGAARACVVIDLKIRSKIWRLVCLLCGIHLRIHDGISVIDAPNEANCRPIYVSGVANVETGKCGCVRGCDRCT